MIQMLQAMIASSRRLARLAAVAAVTAMLACAGTLSAQVIRVKPQVTADPAQNIRLGDVATVTGTDAKTGESLLNMIIVPGITEARALRAEAILMAVISQIGPGKLADNLQVEGAAT